MKDNMSDSEDQAMDNMNTYNSFTDSFDKESSLEYLPNELRYSNKFKNDEMDILLQGPQNADRQAIEEFFRGIILCH